MPVSPGWAIELEGEQVDLDDFEIELSRPHSPWVERDGDRLLLRSMTWVDLKTSSEVMYDGRRLIEQLNGAARLVHADAREVRLGALRRFDENGRPIQVIIGGTINMVLAAMRARGRGSVSPEPATVKLPNFMQRAIKAADKDATNVRSELLRHIARADNWFDLYKAIEFTEVLKGGEHAIKFSLESNGFREDWQAWKLARMTANHYRHALPKANPLPPDPPGTPQEGLGLVLPTIRRVVRGEL